MCYIIRQIKLYIINKFTYKTLYIGKIYSLDLQDEIMHLCRIHLFFTLEINSIIQFF